MQASNTNLSDQSQVNKQSQQQSIKKKQTLKQEAKQMLLKQCYKMAMNKYLRLIGMGAEGFSQREWSVIHLNTAISMQFQSKLEQALEKTNEAIKIDPTYEKAYYRRLQILDEMGEYEVIFHDNIVPPFMKNAEIEKLREDIRQKYRLSIGLNKLESKIKDQQFQQRVGGQTKFNKFIEDSYLSIFRRLIQHIDNMKQSIQSKNQKDYQFVQNTCDQLSNHYKFLILYEQNKNKQIGDKNENVRLVDYFYQNIHRLCVKYAIGTDAAQSNQVLQMLAAFWKEYCEIYMKNLTDQQIYNYFSSNNSQQKSPHRMEQALIGYCPVVMIDSKLMLRVINAIIKLKAKQNRQMVSNFIRQAVKLIHNNQSVLTKSNKQADKILSKIGEDQIREVVNTIDSFIENVVIANISPTQLDIYAELELLAYCLLSFEQQLTQFAYNKIKSSINLQFGSQKLQIMIYRITHQLAHAKHSPTEPIREVQFMLAIITKLLARMLLDSKNNTFFAPLFICYSSIRSTKVTALKQLKQKASEQYAQLQQTLFKIINNQAAKASFKTIESYLSYMLSVNVMAHLNPIYIIQYIQATLQKKKNQSLDKEQNTIYESLQQMCKVDKILAFIVPNTASKSSRYVLSIYLQILTTLVVSHPIFLSQVLSHPFPITTIYHTLHSSVVPKSKQNVIDTMNLLGNSIKLLFSCVVDISAEQEADYADKMGVSRQQIAKARQLQGENRDTKLLAHISKSRQNMVKHIITKDVVPNCQWQKIIANIIQGINSNQIDSFAESNKVLSGMGVGVLMKLAQRQPSKFYAPSIINFMLTTFQNHKPNQQSKSKQNVFDEKTCYSICRFFSIICKKCNSNIFPYPKLQSIANCLIHLIQAGKHQLHIFESFLSLINLSNRSIQIPLQIVQLGLLEQNQYIVHGSLQLFNNILVNTDYSSKKDVNFWSKLSKLRQITCKYYNYYKQNVTNQAEMRKNQEVTINNYSHPYKIYCTLLSVLLVLDSIDQNRQQEEGKNNKARLKIQEFQKWSAAQKIMKQIDKNKGDISMAVFKLVLHHVENKSLPSNWYKGLQGAIERLKHQDMQKWKKINKYIK